MEFAINANVCDQTAKHIADSLRTAFAPIKKDLSKDYGGTIEHLWIDFELLKEDAERCGPFPFRFQKRVSGSSFTRLTGLPAPVRRFVGHYSVRPDFDKLLRLPVEAVADYALSLIYASTLVLVDKQKRLGGFDAHRFRSDFLKSCKEHGYPFALLEGAG